MILSSLMLASGCSLPGWFMGETPPAEMVTTPDGSRRRGNKKRRERSPGGGASGPPVSLADLAAGDNCGELDETGELTLQIPFGGKVYDTWADVPEGAGPRPLVILLHGGQGGSSSIVNQTGMGDTVRNGAIVLAPESAGRNNDPAYAKWNNETGEEAEGRDDVAFLDAMSKALREHACVDRVLVVGFSGGAHMANRWQCQGSNPPDAVMTAAGRLLVDPESCKQRAVPVRGYHGTEDNKSDLGLDHLQSVELWAKRNGCSDRFDEVKEGQTTCRTWKGCKADTVYCSIQGFPHAFPAGNRRQPACDHDAGVTGWRWFEQATKK